jgi:hypothetical protein
MMAKKYTSVFIRSKICIILISFLCLLSCDKNSTEPESESYLEPIADDWTAKDAVENVAECVRIVLKEITTTTFNDVTVEGISGSANISGKEEYTNSSCGTDCIRSDTDVDVTVLFDNYKAKTSSNEETTLSGTVLYRDTRWNRQSGLYYSSGGKVYCDGSNVKYKAVVYDDSGKPDWGYSDTISFDASGGTYLDGSCTVGNGTTYYF